MPAAQRGTPGAGAAATAGETTMAQLSKWWPQSALGRIVLVTLLALLLGTLILVLLAAGQVAEKKNFWSSLASAAITAGAAYVLGAFVGCLFGIPQRVVPASDLGQAAAASAGLYRPGNQLEQVSDWLLKVLLGASLTQLGNVTLIGDYFEEFVGSAAGAMAIITYFSFVGLLSGYFMMIAYLAKLIRRSGEDLVRKLDRELRRIKTEYALHQSLYGDSAAQDSAVSKALGYLSDHPEGSADLFGHLACAYGQRYERELLAGRQAASPEMKQILDKAVEYGSKAVRRDPKWAHILHDLYHAPDNAVENDWAVFRRVEGSDPENKVKSFIEEVQRTARA